MGSGEWGVGRGGEERRGEGRGGEGRRGEGRVRLSMSNLLLHKELHMHSLLSISVLLDL